MLLKEGEQFARTLATGMALLEEAIAALGALEDASLATWPSSCTTPTAFRRTSPPTSRASAASKLDMAGYEREMDAQRERARAASRFGVDLRGGAGPGHHHRFLRLRAASQTNRASSRC